MVSQILGNYLVSCQKISQEQLNKVFDSQKKVRVKLGLVAVAEKLMTPEQAEAVNRTQAVKDMRFGDIAIEKGYLTSEQVSRLLSLQGNEYMTFSQAIVDLGYMSFEELEACFEDYKKANGFTSTDIDSLKSGDIDRIIPLFFASNCNDSVKMLVAVAIRTILRLIDVDVYLDKAYFTDSIKGDGVAMQALDGEKKACLAFMGKGDSLLAIANPFAGEKFENVDEDSLDAVAEMINCINGLFATKMHHILELDMLPPEYVGGDVTAAAREICVVPLFISGKPVNMLITFDEILKF